MEAGWAAALDGFSTLSVLPWGRTNPSFNSNSPIFYLVRLFQESETFVGVLFPPSQLVRSGSPRDCCAHPSFGVAAGAVVSSPSPALVVETVR